MRSLTAKAAERPLQETKTAQANRRSGKQQRTMPRRERRRRVWSWVAVALVIGVIGATFQAIREGWHAQAFVALDEMVDDGYRAVGLTVEEVTLTGRDKAGMNALRRALGVEVGTPILRLDLDELQTRLESVGWIASAEVQRHLPDRLHVAITERVAFARWQRDGQTSLIDRDGEIILSDVGHRFAYLPRVVGSGANVRAAELLDLLDASPRLARQVRSASLIRERRWDVTLESGITVSLPEQGADAAWQHLDEPKHRKRLLADDVGFVDMRIPGRVIVRGRDSGGAQKPQEQET